MPSFDTTEQGTSAKLVDVLDAFRAHHPDGDIELLRRAHDVAKEAHAGQYRKTGDPYISHPLPVAYLLAQYGFDEDTGFAAFLHDTLADTRLTLEPAASHFG